MSSKDTCIRVIDFSRNFGKESALLAGLKYAKGDFILLSDADLQDPLELILDMFRVLQTKQVDMVCVRRKSRSGDSLLRRILSKWFYKIYGLLSEVELVDGVRDFRLMKSEVLEAILSLNEYHRFSKAIFEWVGFRKQYLEYEYIARHHGESKWGVWKLFKYAIEGIVSFSTMPLRLAFVVGFVVSFLALIYGGIIIAKTLIFGNPVRGYPSLVCIVMFLGGIQLIVMGIIGEYIARIYEQIKNRPHFIQKKHKEEKEVYEKNSD